MAHVGHDVVDKLLQIFTKAVSTSLLIVLFFILQYIFDMKFQCSCKSGLHPNGVLYLTLPPLILTWVLVYIESYNQRRLCDCKKCLPCLAFKKCFLTNCLSSFLRILLKFISVSGIWITAVLFDGDWYICLQTNLHSNHTGMPCKDQNNLEKDENLLRNSLKIESLGYGLALICAVLTFWTMIEVIWACRIRPKQRKRDNGEQCCCPPYYQIVYEKLLEEQVSNHLKEELTELAAERAKTICQQHLKTIKDYEKNISDNGVEVGDSWHKISGSSFYMQHERQEQAEALGDEHQSDTDNVPLITVNRDRVWTPREEHLQFNNDSTF